MTEQALADLLAASSPYKTFVTDLQAPENNKEDQKLGKHRRKGITKYVTGFFTALLAKLRRPTVSSSAHSAIDTSNSLGNTTTDSSLHSQHHAVSSMHQSLGNDRNAAAQTMSIETATPMDMNETATSIHPTTEHYMSVMSPISHSSSQHSMEISSDNETSEESVKSRLFLQNVSSSYGFDDSVPDAKPFYMYTRKDLIPVVCVPSFLYIVFRNPNSFEATFFKV